MSILIGNWRCSGSIQSGLPPLKAQATLRTIITAYRKLYERVSSLFSDDVLVLPAHETMHFLQDHSWDWSPDARLSQR